MCFNGDVILGYGILKSVEHGTLNHKDLAPASDINLCLHTKETKNLKGMLISAS